jgi:phenylpropionate dioxygenase-like ring-hydroxylating dioxygenase large terminal subunit
MKKTDQERLTRVGPGTPLGNVLRRYWAPVCLSEELPERGGPPLRVKLFGENLVAFRQADGQVGLLANKCAHRGADLWFGRNEGEGLRCLYHGWKYDLSGRCVEMPNEPAEATFKEKVRQTAYPCREAGGAVWAYLGPAETMPDLPMLECLVVPDGHVRAYKREQEAYFMQCLEGDIDSSHVGFLHRDLLNDQANADLAELSTIPAEYRESVRDSGRWQIEDLKPRIETLVHDSGVFVAVIRRAGEGRKYVRVNQWQMPFYTGIPAESGDTPLMLHAWVPVDEANTMVYNFMFHPARPLTEAELAAGEQQGDTYSANMPGTYKPYYNKTNNYGIDERGHVPGTGTRWTSIVGAPAQDMAMTESIGFDHDRALENLASADVGVIQFRRSLLHALEDYEAGRPMMGADPSSYFIRQYSAVIDENTQSWPDELMRHTRGGVDTYRPSGLYANEQVG